MDSARWGRLSLAEQMGHITSEITRARIWEEKGNLSSREKALERALELVDLTLAGCSHPRLRELARLRELVCHCLAGSSLYRVTLRDLERFGLTFVAGR